MKIDDYQRLAMKTARMTKGPGSQLMMAMGLAGEVGETVDLIKKVHFHDHPLDRAKLAEELGDVLWYLAGMAEAHGMDLSQIAHANVAKLRDRYPEGFSSERSINRTDGDEDTIYIEPDE